MRPGSMPGWGGRRLREMLMYQTEGGQSPVFPKTSKLHVDQWPRLLVKDVIHHYLWSPCPQKPPPTSQKAQ